MQACPHLPHRFFHFAQPVGTFEHFARFGAVGGADDTVSFHQVDQMGGAAIADPQPPLQQGSRGFPELDHQAYGIVVKLVVFVVPAVVL